jgi:hypothetical protein
VAAAPASAPRRREALADHPTASADTLMQTPAAASAPSSAVQPRGGRDDSVSVQRVDAAKEAEEATARTFVRRRDDEAEEELV